MSCFILEDVCSMGRCFVLLSGVSFSHEKEEEETEMIVKNNNRFSISEPSIEMGHKQSRMCM